MHTSYEKSIVKSQTVSPSPFIKESTHSSKYMVIAVMSSGAIARDEGVDGINAQVPMVLSQGSKVDAGFRFNRLLDLRQHGVGNGPLEKVILQKDQVANVGRMQFCGGAHTIAESQGCCRLFSRRTAPVPLIIALVPTRMCHTQFK